MICDVVMVRSPSIRGDGWSTWNVRMCRCDFYTPRDSSKAQLLEAKENLQRMLANIPPAGTTDRRPHSRRVCFPRNWRPRDRQPAADYRGQPGRTVHEFHIMVPVRLFFDVLMEGVREAIP